MAFWFYSGMPGFADISSSPDWQFAARCNAVHMTVQITRA